MREGYQMKVLFVNHAWNLPANMVSDYQADMVYHGLFSIKDDLDWVMPTYPMWHMHEQAKNRDDFNQIWGKGFTMYGNLSEEIDLPDNADAINATHIIVPVHHTLATSPHTITKQLMNLLFLCKDAKIAVVDGWDRTDIDGPLLGYCRANGIKYFKRECTFTDETVKPISFAFPREKARGCRYLERKKNDIAPLIPVNQSIDPSYMSTYIYDDEDSYYKMYEDSAFALTSKKGGWDTLRHYEIIANGCLPIFVDIDNCPEYTLWNFPKHLCKEVLRLQGFNLNIKGQGFKRVRYLENCSYIDKNNPGYISDRQLIEEKYHDLQFEMFHYLLEKLTTDKLAQYVLETMDEN